MKLLNKMLSLVAKTAEAFGLLDPATAKRLRIFDKLGSQSSWTGRPVTEQSAIAQSVVWACRRIISEAVAFLPCQLMQLKNGERIPATTKPLYRVLHDEPNPAMSDMEFRELLTANTVTRGNEFAWITRRSVSGEAIALQPFSQDTTVTADFDKSKRLIYVVKEGNASERPFAVESDKPQDIFHLRGPSPNGVMGYGVVALARNSIALAQIQEEYVSRYFAQGGRRPYILKSPKPFANDEKYLEFRARWKEQYGSPDSFHEAVILEGQGVEYQELGWSLEDAQFLQSRQFTVPEICRWFLISPHLVGDLSRATFSNIEQLALEFVKLTLMAWITRWEKALNRSVLTPEEKAQGFYCKLNVNSLLRGDFLSRMQGYSIMLQNGIANQNEIRALEDWNPFEGGDDYHIQLNMQALTGGQPAQQPQQSLVRLGTGKKGWIM